MWLCEGFSIRPLMFSTATIFVRDAAYHLEVRGEVERWLLELGYALLRIPPVRYNLAFSKLETLIGGRVCRIP